MTIVVAATICKTTRRFYSQPVKPVLWVSHPFYGGFMAVLRVVLQ